MKRWRLPDVPLCWLMIVDAGAGIMSGTFLCGWTLEVASGRYRTMRFPPPSVAPVGRLSLEVIRWVMPAANPGWSVITPVEESVTFKMAHSQGSLPVIRNVYYGLWSHPVNVCVCGSECVCLKVSLGVESYLALWHEPPFPFSPPYKCLSAWCPLRLHILHCCLFKVTFQHI